jgi:hypothetical protein
MLSQTRLFLFIPLCALLLFPFSSYGGKSKKSVVLNPFARQSNGLDYTGFKGQVAPSKDLLDVVGRQTRWDNEGSEHNPTGLRLRFVKIDDQPVPGGRVATRYRVYAEGAPENKVYAFGTWTVAKPFGFDPRDMYVNGQGLVMIHRPKPEQAISFTAPEDELEVSPVTDSAEPVRYLLSSRDNTLELFGTVVPHPVQMEDQGCRLEVRLAAMDTSVVLVADGFPAKEKFPLVLESEGAESSEMMSTDMNGHAVMAAFPYVPGKTQGLLKATAEGPNCLPAVTLPWGPAAAPAPKTP